jgi:hypothetical protein
VTIARRADTTLLVRRDSSAWAVNGHPAAAGAVGDLLAALADSARRSEVVAERSGSHGGLGVDSGGTRVRVSGRGGVLADLVVGNRSRDLDGGYLRLASDSTVWLVRGGLAAALERSTDEWRDRRIAGVPADSVARIEVSRGRHSYTVRKGERGWTLANGAATDSTAVAELLGAFGQVEAGGFATAAQADSARFSPADRRVRLDRRDGTRLLALAFDSMPGGFWVRADSGGPVYRMESWAAERVTPEEKVVRGR